MFAVAKQGATARASAVMVLPHPLTWQKTGSSHARDIWSSCYMATRDSQEKTHSPSPSSRFSSPTCSDAAICFRHPEGDAEESHWCDSHSNMTLCQAAQPQHPQQQALPKTSLLVLAVRHRVSRHGYPGHVHHASAGTLSGPWHSPWLALCTAAGTPGQEHLPHHNHVCKKHASLLLFKLQPLEGNPVLRVRSAPCFDTVGSR